MSVTKKIKNRKQEIKKRKQKDKSEKKQLKNFVEKLKGRNLYIIRIFERDDGELDNLGLYYGEAASEMMVYTHSIPRDVDDIAAMRINIDMNDIKKFIKTHKKLNPGESLLLLKVSPDRDNNKDSKCMILTAADVTVQTEVGKFEWDGYRFAFKLNELTLYFCDIAKEVA